MEITEVRIKLIEKSEDRLRAFCSITIDDCFVVRDLKIIEGNNGPFVAMPSRKLTANCRKCKSKNHLRARYCNSCGNRLRHEDIELDHDGRPKLYADIAHPVNAECREMIQRRVIEELENELQRAAEPGYYSNYDDDYSPRTGRPAETIEKDPELPPGSGRVDDSQPSSAGPHHGASADSPQTEGSAVEPDSAAGQGPSGNSPTDPFGEGIFE